MTVTLGAVPVLTPKYRHTGWDSTTNKALGRPEEPIRVGKWWYMPGNYNRVEDVDATEYTRTHLTRFSGLASDAYSLDTTWQPDPDARTYGLASDGTLVTVVGAFDTIAGATRHKVAQFTAATGAITTFFNGLACNGTVQAVAIDSAGNYWFGGDFTSIAGSSRTRLAVINPAGTVQALNVACTQSVIDLKWDPVNAQMLVLMDNDGTIGGGATCKVAAITTGGTVNWRNNPNAGTFSFQVDCDQTYAYVSTNGNNETFQYLLTTGGVGAFTFWSTDGNNQGVTSYGGNVFIGHHGDYTAIVKDSTTHPADAQHLSKGIVAISVAGVIQTWRPQFLQNGSDPYGGGVLKVFRIGRDSVNNQVCFTGDFTKVTSLDGTQTVNARRVALFVDSSAPPPPPPPPTGSVKVIAAGDFTVGSGGLTRVGTLVGNYYAAGDTVAMIACGDSAYQAGTLAEFNANLNPVMGGYMKQWGRDWWYPTLGSHDYGTWGTTGVSSVGITGYESYFRTAKALNIGAATRYYRADDIVAADGSATNWVLVRVNGVKAQAGFAQTENGINDGLVVPMAAGSPQYIFLQTTLQGIADAGKCAVVAVGHPRYTSPSTGNHSSELRINPLWQLLDQYLPGRAIVLSGHQHNYERFRPQRAGGVLDTTNGNVQFVVGIGGGAAYVRSSVLANSAAYEDNTNGVLELELFDDHAVYTWRKVAGETSNFTDTGTITMNVTPPPPPPPPGDVTASGKGAAGSTVTVNKPAGVVSGSVMVASIALTGGDSLVTVPTGWTAVSSGADGVGSGTTTKVYQSLYKKTAGGSEPASYTWAGPATTDSIYVNIVALPAGSTVGAPSIVKSASTGAMDIAGPGGDVTGLTAGDEVLVFSATDWGPRPWADSGTLLGFMPNESTGDPVNDAGITRLEGLIGRDIAVGHSMYPSSGSDLAVQGTFPETAGSATGVTSDWESGRMSFISWPRQEAWLYTTGQTPDQAPRIGLAEVANGDHDALIASWATKLKTWGQPTWFRPFWEMNGGDPPWSIGYETSGTAIAWRDAFIAAWQRVYTIMCGTQVQVDNLSPAYSVGAAIQADNLYFTWNPQEFESSPNAAVNRDSNWPGAGYTDGAATELYLSPGDTATGKMTNAGGGGFGGIAHQPFYNQYAAVYARRISTGEGGNRWQGSPDDAAAITRTQGFTTMFKNYPAHAVFCWWDGGSTGGMGQSALAGKPTALRNAENAFFNDAVMKPELAVTLQPQLSGFSVLTEGRAPVGKALTNYGPAQLSGTVLRKTAAAATVAAATVKGYGYGRYVTTTLPISSSGVVITHPPTITSFTPASGPIGTLITITGTNLLTVDSITYAPGIAGAHTQISDTQMTSNVVSGAVTGTFAIHNPDGTATSPTPFTVGTPPPPPSAPAVTSFTPTFGPIGTVVTLTGTNFTSATRVRFNGLDAVFSVLSDTQIRATLPASATSGTIAVTNSVGTGTSSGSFTIQSGATDFYWRVRVKDAAGNTSAWSDPVHVFILPKGSLTINAPTSIVEETTPDIDTTLSGRAQAAISYTLEEQQPSGLYEEVWHQRRMKAPVAAGANYSFTVPKIEREGHPHGKRHSPIRKRSTNYRLTVRSWDAEEDRVHTPDDPPYAEASVVFQWQGGPHNPAPTVGLTATPDGAGVVLQWSRLAVPDAWTLLVDDEVVHEPDAIDWQLSGTAYRATYYGATPMSEHTYEVAAVSISGGHRYVSNGNPTATATTHPIGIWLADAVIDSEGTPANVIQMLGQPDSPAAIGQAAETFTPVGRRDPVTIYDSLRGYEDTIDGAIIQSTDDLATFEAFKGETGLELRLILGEMNVPVELGDVSIGRMPVDATMFPVSFSVIQVDDFAINLKQRGD